MGLGWRNAIIRFNFNLENSDMKKWWLIKWRQLQFLLIKWRLILSGLIGIVIALGAYIRNFHAHEISKNPESWAHFGDYLGGIFSFFSFIALLYTVRLQIQELRATKEELKLSRQAQQESAVAQEQSAEVLRKQQFENTFFQLLNQIILQLDKLQEVKANQSSIINDLIIFAHKRTQLSGFQNLHKLKTRLSDTSIYGTTLNDFQQYCQKVPEFSRFCLMVYQLLKLIYNSAYADKNNNIPSLEEKQYSNIIRSMLSSDILQLMAFYCYRCDEQSQFKKYQNLIERYSFFEHISFKFNVEGGENVNMLVPTFTNKLIGENKIYFALMIYMYYKYNRMAFGENDTLKGIEFDLNKIKIE